MVKTKYGKYILKASKRKNPQGNAPAVTPIELKGLKDWGGIQHRLKWNFVTQPIVIEDTPHTHDFDEFMCFFGCDPAGGPAFEAEVELSLGAEGEKQIIKAPSIVCIPKGLIHCPIKFKKISKPVMYCQIYLAPEYVVKPVSR